MSSNPNEEIFNKIKQDGEVLDLNEVEEDYLEVDNPLPGQNYFCFSVINPENVIVDKNRWKYYKFQQHVLSSMNNFTKNKFNELLDKDEIEHSDVQEIRDSLNNISKSYLADYDTWNDMYKNYEFNKGDEDDKEFDKQNNYQTSIRGMKVRGVYNSYKEAETRAAYLQKTDPRFDILIAPVGHWVPTVFDINKIDYKHQRSANEDLNELMKAYAEEEERKEIYFNQRHKEQTSSSRKDNMKNKVKSVNSMNK
jgi:hypothetical protein